MSEHIIGYKLKDKKYEEVAVLLIKRSLLTMNTSATTFKEMDDLTDKGIDIEKNSVSYVILKEAGILDVWFEPVYAKPKPNQWYTLPEVDAWLKNNGYCEEIRKELGPMIVEGYNMAYKKGYQMGGSDERSKTRTTINLNDKNF